MAKLTFEQRSQAAEKGWKTRRANMLKAGKMTADEYYDIYGELPDGYHLYDYFDSDDDNTEIEEPEDYDNSDDYINLGELIDRRITFTLERCVNGVQMANYILNILNGLKERDPQEYYKNLIAHQDDIDNHLLPFERDYDIGEMYDSGIKILDYASGITGYSAMYEAAFKDARRNDAFNKYHREHPNAKYRGRRKTY